MKQMFLSPFQGWGFYVATLGLAPRLIPPLHGFVGASALKSSHDEVDRGACEHLCSRCWAVGDDN